MGCGPKIMVPPVIDLQQFHVIGIIEFDFSSEGNLGHFATTRFIEEIRRDQGMVRIVDCGNKDEVLKTVGHDRLGQNTYKDIGYEYEIDTIITGELLVSGVRPNVSIAPGLGFIHFSAEVDAT